MQELTMLNRHILNATVGGVVAASLAWMTLGPSPALAQAAPKAGAQKAAPAPTTPPPPVRTEQVTYDSWTVTCQETMEKPVKRECAAVLRVIEQKQRRVLLSWIVRRSDSGALTTVFQTPTGVQIQRGVEFKLGDKPVRKAAYSVCGTQQCESTLEMDNNLAREVAAATNAVITIRAANGRDINFNLTIKGSDKALPALFK